MHGKDYIFTVQAINRNQKMSLVSDEAIFRVADPDHTSNNEEVITKPSTSTSTHIASPITYLESTEATPDEITLVWSDVSDASDYKLKWDRGEQQEGSLFYTLASTTNGLNTFKIDRTNSGGVMGTQKLKSHGGIFNFKVSYMSTRNGQESEISNAFEVKVHKSN
jgi:hypothetical protein